MEQPADGNGAPKPYTPPRSAQPQAPAPGPAAEASRPSLEDGLQPRRRIPFGREEMQLSFAPLVKRTAPAVVNVYAAREVRQRSPFAGDPFFEQFFGREFNMPPRMQSSLGSGVIVRGDGIVVTNNHVIEGADAVKVALADGREFESKILLKDKRIDLAILKIENGQAFPVLPIGDSDSLEIGDLVLAIGNPFGVGQTTTTGIVSAVARTSIGVSDFGFFIQTDAAINPGNSGGALIDMGGRLIGINTAIFSRSGGSIGIGFAIPANIVAAMLRTVERGGDVFERPWIGAEFDAVSPEIAESLGMDRPTGAIVVDIEKGGPADKAGIRPGDVVVRIDEHPVEHPDALGYRLSTLSFGDTVNIEVMRQGRRANMPVQVVAPPGEQRAVAVPIEGRSPFAGARVAKISRRLSREFDLPQDAEGVVIVEVEDGSPAARVGFRPGDVVMALGRQKVRDAEQLRALAQEDGNWWRFTLNRGGRIINQVLRY
jgi:Do/DeqQ family serine protease